MQCRDLAELTESVSVKTNPFSLSTSGLTSSLKNISIFEQRVSGRMVLLDISATGEENLINRQESGNQMNDLEYRRKQLLKLQEAVIDLEDLSGDIYRRPDPY